MRQHFQRAADIAVVACNQVHRATAIEPALGGLCARRVHVPQRTLDVGWLLHHANDWLVAVPSGHDLPHCGLHIRCAGQERLAGALGQAESSVILALVEPAAERNDIPIVIARHRVHQFAAVLRVSVGVSFSVIVSELSRRISIPPQVLRKHLL